MQNAKEGIYACKETGPIFVRNEVTYNACSGILIGQPRRKKKTILPEDAERLCAEPEPPPPDDSDEEVEPPPDPKKATLRNNIVQFNVGVMVQDLSHVAMKENNIFDSKFSNVFLSRYA